MTASEEQSVHEFADTAREYCSWVEESNLNLRVGRILLARLHLTALHLPNWEPTVSEDASPNDASTKEDEEYRRVRDKLAKLPFDGYWDIFDPLNENDREPVHNSLSDDLADIWRDLKKGLSIYGSGTVRDAVWEWRFFFEIHWGQHLTGAQRAIHSFMVEKELPSHDSSL